MAFMDMTGLVLAMASTLGLAAWCRVINRRAHVVHIDRQARARLRESEWSLAIGAPRPARRSQAWVVEQRRYELLMAGGARAVLERSPAAYDVAIYCGGNS